MPRKKEKTETKEKLPRKRGKNFKAEKIQNQAELQHIQNEFETYLKDVEEHQKSIYEMFETAAKRPKAVATAMSRHPNLSYAIEKLRQENRDYSHILDSTLTREDLQVSSSILALDEFLKEFQTAVSIMHASLVNYSKSVEEVRRAHTSLRSVCVEFLGKEGNRVSHGDEIPRLGNSPYHA